jgi:predicted site-specific integrase-resolvase
VTRELEAGAWYEAKEVAETLGVTVRTLRRSGIPCAIMTRRRVLYLGKDVNDWLEARKRQGRLRKVS